MKQPNLVEIKKLIAEGDYKTAHTLIDEGMETTLYLQELVDAKCMIYMATGNAKKALELYYEYYLFIQGIPIYREGIKNYSKAAALVGKKMLSTAMECVYISAPSNKLMPKSIEIDHLQRQLTQDVTSAQLAYDLACAYAKQWQTMQSVVYLLLAQKIDPNLACDELWELLSKYQGASFIIQRLKNTQYTICLLDDGDEMGNRLLSFALELLGHNIYLILPPTQINVDSSTYDADEILAISFNNVEGEDNIRILRPVELVYNDTVIVNTLETILVQIATSFCSDDTFLFMAETHTNVELYQNVELRKQLQIAYQYHAPSNIPQLSVSFMGNYLYAASHMYGFDVPTQTNAKPEVKISVVLPVRGGIDTFQYTLQTCLEQDYEDYEIVITDNNDINDHRISDYVSSLKAPHSDKIRYYKTPYVLPMHKNFEYGYLRTRGELIFSLGSDDGLLSYALRMISQIMDKFPDQMLYVWKRLLYMWPNFRKDKSDHFGMLQHERNATVSVQSMSSLLSVVKTDWQSIYNAPTLYINSGMRKKGLLNMIQATGKIIEGEEPDMYAGVLNMMIFDEFARIDYPMAIAGMSGSSNGASQSVENRKIVPWETAKIRNGFSTSFILNRNPPTNEENRVMPLNLYTNFLCEASRLSFYGIVPDEYSKNIDFEYIFSKFVSQISTTNIETQLLISLLKKNAKSHGREISLLVEQLLSQQIKNQQSLVANTHKTYNKGCINNVAIVIDASDFGISNIYEARCFYQKLFNLF